MLSLSASLFILSGCGKNGGDDRQQEQVCRIVTSAQGNSVQTLAYDDHRRLLKITEASGANLLTVDFVHSGNQISNTYTYNGVVYIVDTVWLNNKDLISKIHSTTPTNGNWERRDLTYNASDELLTVTAVSNLSPTPR